MSFLRENEENFEIKMFNINLKLLLHSGCSVLHSTSVRLVAAGGSLTI